MYYLLEFMGSESSVSLHVFRDQIQRKTYAEINKHSLCINNNAAKLMLKKNENIQVIKHA